MTLQTRKSSGKPEGTDAETHYTRLTKSDGITLTENRGDFSVKGQNALWGYYAKYAPAMRESYNLTSWLENTSDSPLSFDARTLVGVVLVFGGLL